MLVLGRKVGESIMIGDDIMITVCKAKVEGLVKIGIEAPKHHKILRYELYRKTQNDTRVQS